MVMNLKKRFTLLGIVLCSFIVLAAVTITFSLGYRFDFKTRSFVATGTIVIASQPKGAAIFLNGEKTDYVTPAIVRFLKPGDYDLELKKAGYTSWKKNFTSVALH